MKPARRSTYSRTQVLVVTMSVCVFFSHRSRACSREHSRQIAGRVCAANKHHCVIFVWNCVEYLRLKKVLALTVPRAQCCRSDVCARAREMMFKL